FHGIFDGDDLHFFTVYFLKHGVQRRRLPASRRTGDQDDAVRTADHLLEFLHIGLAESQLMQMFHADGLVEYSEYDALTVYGGQDRDADIDALIVHPQLDA